MALVVPGCPPGSAPQRKASGAGPGCDRSRRAAAAAQRPAPDCLLSGPSVSAGARRDNVRVGIRGAVVTPELAQPVGLQAAAEEARTDAFHRTFFQVFNFTSVALVFWFCFALVLASLLKAVPVMGGSEWFVMLAYLTRQFLASGLLGLVGVAFG